MLSGEALTSIPVEELHDVRALKQCLNQLHGLPPRFRQRVFLRGELLEDTTKLDSPMDLDLVVLAFADVSQSDVDDLILHAEEGIMAEVVRFESEHYTRVRFVVSGSPNKTRFILTMPQQGGYTLNLHLLLFYIVVAYEPTFLHRNAEQEVAYSCNKKPD